MSNAQELIDRRRLRRKLGFWRILAILAVAAVFAAIFLPALGIGPGHWRLAGGAGRSLDTIARVEIEGLITENDKLIELLDDLGEEKGTKAVILRVDSPGGTTVGGESIYEAVRRLAEKKPVAAEVGTLAASAGYLIASGADHIVARQTSIVGSIGTIFQYVDASQLLGTVGVSVNAIKSSPLKAEPSPFAPAPEEAKEMIRRMVVDSYEWFVGIVAGRRPIDLAEVRRLADGSVFTGRQALQNRLVDALGGEIEVRRWLEDQRQVPKGLEIVLREPKREGGTFSLFASAKSALFGALGIDLSAIESGSAALNGAMMSLWRPDGAGIAR
ncbi:Clp protease [Aureimonas endophytica]|uniref:Clp protease n=1 Tax=Aureimonas endophytica TaxID=2027858 RepID=A0A917EC92_9HYPH|nr:signal peptide peptidase SppA [Aureimonas endophytica]GGE21705.1 Clp protease [Aureimonas endophytica]